MAPTFHHLLGHKASLEEVTCDNPYLSKVSTFNHSKEATRKYVSASLDSHRPPVLKESLCQYGIFGVAYSGLLEKAVAPHSSTLAWKIPWTEEPGRLQSMGLLRVRHD